MGALQYFAAHANEAVNMSLVFEVLSSLSVVFLKFFR